MTGKQRAEVYLLAARRLEALTNSYICCAMFAAEYIITEKLPNEAALKMGIPNGPMTQITMAANYPEIWKRKPPYLPDPGAFWFPRCSSGRQERIRILLEAAKEAKIKRE
jgi:hypothetical protein